MSVVELKVSWSTHVSQQVNRSPVSFPMQLETNSMTLANSIRVLEALHLLSLKLLSLIQDLSRLRAIKQSESLSSLIMILMNQKDHIHLDLLLTDLVVSLIERPQSLLLISMVLATLRIPMRERKISQEKSMRG